MRHFKICIRKDIKELIRSNKMLIGFAMCLVLGILLLLASRLIAYLSGFVENFVGLPAEFSEMLGTLEEFFSNDLKMSISVFAADIGLFYAILIVIFTFGMIPSEIKRGQIILPLTAGYDKKTIALSKMLVYSVGLAIPVFPVYLLYYGLGSLALGNNLAFGYALYNAILLTFGMFAHCCMSFSLSMLYKYKIATVFSMLGLIIVVPEILARFDFGKYFPTHIYTYVFNSGENIKETIIPVLGMLVIVFLCAFMGLKFGMKYKTER